MNAVPIIVQTLRTPEAVRDFSLAQWDILIRQARRVNLLCKLYFLFKERNLFDDIPEAAQRHFLWEINILERHQQAVQGEVQHIKHALAQVDTPVVLLKGAAYALAQIPTGLGRLFSDIDILVSKEKLNDTESALMQHGWTMIDLDEYDQHYYRTWMHELPPMTHITRGSSIDVHHAILPETGYVHPDPKALLAHARPIPHHPNLYILSPVDMFLHSAAHLFHEGEFDKGLRDLTDLDSLLRHFGQQAEFWDNLVSRAKTLELTRPLFYALHYTDLILQTPVPASVRQDAQIGRPNALLLKVMDTLFLRALLPKHASCQDMLSRFAHFALFIRGNWLRMPPLLLAKHLFHKAFISPKKANA